MRPNYLSIDIGGTTIKTALIDHSGKIQSKNRVRTPQNLEELLKVLKIEVDRVLDLIRGIAISCPGKIDTKTGIIYFGGALPYLDGISLKNIFEKQYALPTSVINDGKAAALSELWVGNLKGIKNGAAIVLGTGIGGGLILEGKLFQGSHFQAGELSFMMKPSSRPSMRDMYGSIGSAVALVEQAAEILHLADKQDGEEVFKAINQGDERVYPIFQMYCREIAYVILNMQSILDLQRVVIGGGISVQEILIKEIICQYEAVREEVKIIQNSMTAVEILPCQFRNEANLLGALYQLLLHW